MREKLGASEELRLTHTSLRGLTHVWSQVQVAINGTAVLALSFIFQFQRLLLAMKTSCFQGKKCALFET